MNTQSIVKISLLTALVAGAGLGLSACNNQMSYQSNMKYEASPSPELKTDSSGNVDVEAETKEIDGMMKKTDPSVLGATDELQDL